MKRSRIALALLAVGAAPVFAQDGPIEEIIVTGTKANLGIQDTQTSVAVFTEEELEKQVILNVEDILLRTANVAAGGPNSLNNLSIRGVTLVGVGFAGVGTTANVYVDGSPNSFNANQGANNLWDIAQVEVLRGPQSTVQGRNALAGAIIINTADPEYEWGAKARAMGGNEDQQQYSGMVTGPIFDDQVAFRIAADYRELDFGVTNLDTGNNTRFEEALNLRAKLLIEPKALPDLRVELIAQFADTEFGEFGQANSPVPADDPAFDDFDPFGDETFGLRTRFEDNEVTRYTVDVQYELNEHWALMTLGTYEETKRNTNFGPGSSNNAVGETYTGEVRFTFDYGRVNGWVGGYYFQNEGGDDIVFITPLSILGVPLTAPDAVASIVTDTFTETQNYAFFADITFALNDRWSINLGARFDDEEFVDQGRGGSISVDPPECQIAPFVPGLGGFPCAAIFPISDEPETTNSFNAFLPKGAVIYSFDELRSLSFTVARGYRSGGSYLFALPGGVPETRTYDEEYVWNYELAFRSEWPEQNLTVNANLFYTDWTDQQVSIADPTGAFFGTEILNTGESELYGLEVEVRVEPTPSLSLFSSLGLLQTEFKDFPFAPDTGSEFENLAGRSFNNAPEFNISAGFAYEHESGFFASGTVSYSSDQYSDVTNLGANENDAYVLVNVRGGWRWKNYELALFVDNLFDERFTTRQGQFTVNTATGVADANRPAAFFTVNDPRLFGLELRARIGGSQ